MTTTSGRPDPAAEVRDLLALRDLVSTYAFAADRRDWDGLVGLFTPDGELRIVGSGIGATPPDRVRSGRAEIRASMDRLESLLATTHMVGQSVFTVDGDAAVGETCCIAHHIYPAADGSLRDHVLAIRYVDRCTRASGAWLFEVREAHFTWGSDTALTDPAPAAAQTPPPATASTTEEATP